MNQRNKTTNQLIQELEEAHRKIAELEKTLGIVTDISEPRRTLEELQQSEIRYRSLFENMLEGYVCGKIVFEEGQPVDLIFLEVNRTFESVSGLTNVVGKKASEVIPGLATSNEKLFEIIIRVASTGRPERFELYLKQTDRWLMTSIFCIEKGYLISIFDNITDRKRAEEALAKSEARYRLLAENASDIIFTADKNFRLTYVSPSVEKVTGYSPEEVIQQNLKDLLTPASFEKAIRAYRKGMELEASGLRELRKTITLQLEEYRKNGSTISVETTVTPLRDQQNQLTGFWGITRDITERKKVENERERLQRQVQQAQKMESIGVLAGGIAHDFNNILSTIIGYTELAQMKLNNKRGIDNELDKIMKAAIRNRDLVKHILTFSRQSVIIREPMDIVPVMKETLKFIRASLPSTIEIRHNFAVLERLVVADATQIHQIVMNLCTNAAYAMKEKGGILDIGLKEIVLNAQTRHKLKSLQPGRYLQLTITDTGSGISDRIIGRIFDPFFTTKERGEGTGMGLSVLHGIVMDMGGAVSVYSEPNVGTSFHVLFPIYTGQKVISDISPLLTPKGTGTIILVDDEEGIALSGQGILEQLGYHVIALTNPLEALDAINANPEGVDLILTDLTMPVMTGLELSVRIKDIKPGIPIILCTGFGIEITQQRLKEAGIHDMVMKPMVASELAQAVFQALHPSE